MDLRVTSVAVILMVMFAYGYASKCYQGVAGVHVDEVDCTGSCTTVTTTSDGSTSYVLACIPITNDDECSDVGTGTICYCNTELCNKAPNSGNKAPNSGYALKCYQKIPGVQVDEVMEVDCESGYASKCYQGVAGVQVGEVDCTGSCTTVTTTSDGSTSYVLACNTIAMDNGCSDYGTTTICYCNTELCNKAPNSGNKAPNSGNKAPNSGTVGLSALKITWLVSVVMIIGTRYLH